ncbi:MAG: helix-turn-helix domain-containing protein [Rhodospirillales bacterium]|nr:helix-turn-helix domain-containing protein [Rhodospirillales bacterium]
MMTVPLSRPLVLDPAGADPCAHCDARHASVCNAIPDSDMARLATTAVVVEAAPGTTFINEGDAAGCFFNITRGTAKLFKLLPDGRRQITGFVGVGHFLGLAVSDTYAFSAEAIDHVRFCRFSRTRLRALLDEYPLMEKRLLEVASNELVAAQEQMLLLGRKTARERLASFLASQSRLGVSCQHPRQRFALPMTRGDIADYLGLTIETVSRTLTKLRSEGLIEIPSTTEVVIRAPAALERLAAGAA